MGLLKHFVMPLCVVLHANVAIRIVFLKDFDMVSMFGWPEGGELTPWEEHALGILGGEHLAFLVANLLGIFHENAHVRGLIVLMEAIHWTVGAIDAQRLGFPCVFAYVIAGLCIISLVIHAKEPGIFTKDKNKAKSG
eukprot:CAMPEP_0178475170 /NCGR_PEP_ID=MMETSP0696-20121128/2976_1 /TAXON_ID=265572 /ORGANISM="Extubocellulus spinifer, Strain CCMP396" /LENGTH=136 /DNA_ID=CAMNT_0020102439 /DNA_START=190 /DNA_END=600 /DNA_ORIENTATION=+